MDYPQILSPIINFLHCPTPQAWIDEARKPENLALLLTDHMVCELKAAQNAMLLVRRYVADKADCINGSTKAPCRRPTTRGAASCWTA